MMSAECDIHKCDLYVNDENQYFCQECYLENKILDLERQLAEAKQHLILAENFIPDDKIKAYLDKKYPKKEEGK